jgi:hypothetical protein
MTSLRELRQTISYTLGFGYGCYGLAFQCPWWANQADYRLGYIDGRRAYLETNLTRNRDGRTTEGYPYQ